MKLFVVLAVVALSNAAKLDKTYLPPSHSQTSGGSGTFLETPLGDQGQGQAGIGFARNGNGFSQNGNGFSQNGNGFSQNGNDYAQNGNGFNNFENRPERAQAAFERNAAILRQDNQNDGETYSYAYETENGIYAEENGVATNGVEAQGGFSYTGDDGQVYSIRYTADQNGFVPQGDHLPTPPPIPEEILKALEQNSRDEAAGIYDDGSYSEGKYGNSEDQYSGNQYNGNQYNNNGNFNNQNAYEGDDDSVVTNSALFRNSGNGLNGNQATNKAYLPPNQDRFNPEANQGFSRASQGIFNNGPASQGFSRGQGVNKAYLPPVAGQRNPGFGSRTRQPSFSARNGYRY
ncbi:pupal cuticle protein 36a-like [Ostrinia furnacalis]|uniref:pupal cuticle protein 36a-like n=1 Tax=Ostrinia furnacalis TaxID=93504 RepID=UPI00103FF3D0|nr:pupal cuticle protein 36a-like [Ostrinia furnacalis]